MKILFLPNWHVHCLDEDNNSIQAPDKYIKGEKYWFFKYFPADTEVDIIDIKRTNRLHKLEKRIKFYIWQAILAFFKSKNYDVVISHGAQSGLLYALLSSFRKKNPLHIIIDIGGLNGASESRFQAKLIGYALRKKPEIIIHSSKQASLYNKMYSWLSDKVTFIPFGIDCEYFENFPSYETNSSNTFISYGHGKRDYVSLIKAWNKVDSNFILKIIGEALDINKSNQIQSVGKVPLKELLENIKSAYVIVVPLPVFNYSYGQMTFLQAMAMGKFVIVTETVSTIDYLENAPGAILVKPNSSNDLTNAINTTIKLGYSKIQRLGLENQKYIKDYFHEKIMAKQIFELINKRTNK
jgi:glycosyltransferase involved in cell wall biosynthesis